MSEGEVKVLLVTAQDGPGENVIPLLSRLYLKTVKVSHHGAEALQLLPDYLPDLVLLDAALADMALEDWVHALRQALPASHRPVPMIVLAKQRCPILQTRVAALNAVGSLVTPPRLDALRVLVAQAFAWRDAQQRQGFHTQTALAA